jgi:hypothetical protein
MIRTHTLADEIINRHSHYGTGNGSILDDNELSLLKRFVTDPSSKDALLREREMVDEPGERPGTRAVAKSGSLVGYVIARHGTEDPVLEEGEIERLRGWFVEWEEKGDAV